MLIPIIIIITFIITSPRTLRPKKQAALLLRLFLGGAIALQNSFRPERNIYSDRSNVNEQKNVVFTSWWRKLRL